MYRRFGTVAAIAATLVFADVASADNFSDVYADYQPDNQVTPCLFTKAQLQSAKQQAQSFGDAVYGGFVGELDQEIRRWDSGGCTGVAAPPPAGTNATADFFTVYADWLDDGALRRCGHPKRRLQNTLGEANTVPNFDAHVPGLRSAVRAQLRAINAGRCAAVLPGALRIVGIHARGSRRKPLAEYVTIRNTVRGSVALRRLSLRDRSGNRILLPFNGRLGPGRTLRVTTGCLEGRVRPTKRGGRFYACNMRAQLWNDAGDVVKVVGSGGTVVAQRGYKRFRSIPRF